MFQDLHESSPGGDGRFHEQKTEIKGIIGVRNFWTTAATMKVRKATNIRNRYNQVLHLT